MHASAAPGRRGLSQPWPSPLRGRKQQRSPRQGADAPPRRAARCRAGPEGTPARSSAALASATERGPRRNPGDTMLSSSRVEANIPAADLKRARDFYANVLGLTPTREIDGIQLTYRT